ncbi:MAG: hypothetical protein ACE5G0_10465 [Rhodothermales bacterium]
MKLERSSYLFLSDTYPELIDAIRGWLDKGHTPLQIADAAESAIGLAFAPIVEYAARHMLCGNYLYQSTA